MMTIIDPFRQRAEFDGSPCDRNSSFAPSARRLLDTDTAVPQSTAISFRI